MLIATNDARETIANPAPTAPAPRNQLRRTAVFGSPIAKQVRDGYELREEAGSNKDAVVSTYYTAYNLRYRTNNVFGILNRAVKT